MKTFRTKLKSSLFVLTLISLPLLAKPMGQVTEVTGTVFGVGPDGTTKSLKANDHLDDKSEVMVEEGASLTLNDYYDATYHLIGGSHLKLFDKSVQLKRGKLWVQSKNARHPLSVTTANGNINFWKSEFIVTFDQATSKSQLLVVNGEAEISNALDMNMKYSVSAGSFSLIDPDIENGVPRAPTKTGLASLNSALSEFKRLPPKLKEEGPSRDVASVTTPVKKGEIIFMTTNRLPASVTGGAHKYWKKTFKPKKTDSESVAPITFYGASWTGTPTPAKEAPRSPASIHTEIKAMAPHKELKDVRIDQEFGSSLKEQEAVQPKYKKELEALIEDLKSY